MISFSDYRNSFAPQTIGKTYKSQSDMIMEQTWWNDIASRVAYLYDWEHDTHHRQLTDMHPQDDNYKVPVDIKYLVSSSQTYEKDSITYHLQLRPSQDTSCVSYYEEAFRSRYDATFPVGLYADIEDSKGKWNRWLVVETANGNDPQFPTYEILRCDKIINYIYQGVEYFVPSVLRSQNSYNSGIWTDFKITVPEDVQKFLVPMNRNTENIYYNQRFIIDANVLTEPRCWHVSKINRIASNGMCLVTVAQDIYNPHSDYLDEDGYWWADYFDSNGNCTVAPSNEDVESFNIRISCVGRKEIKAGGSYKKLSADFFVGDEPVYPRSGTWSFMIGDEPAASQVETVVDGNQIKVKFVGSDLYIGQTLVVQFVSDNGEHATLDLPVISL